MRHSNVVRAAQHDCDPPQLSDARSVPAVHRRGVRHRALSRPAHFRPPHLRVLRRRDARQDDGDGRRRQAGVPRRDVEPTRHVHRCRRVCVGVCFFSFLYIHVIPRNQAIIV